MPCLSEKTERADHAVKRLNHIAISSLGTVISPCTFQVSQEMRLCLTW